MNASKARVLLYGGVFSGANDDGDFHMEFFLHAQGIPYRRVTDRDMAEMQFTPEYRLFLLPAGHYFGPVPEWAFGGESARARLRSAVADGMNYLGICSGALIATPVCAYPSAISLHLTDAIPRWKSHTGTGVQFFTVRLSRRLARLAGVRGAHARVWYHNGPVLKRYHRPLYRSLATFEPTPEERAQTREVHLFRKHLRGAAAIAEAKHGRGQVVMCSPHFEFGDGGLHDYVTRLRGWVAKECPDRLEGDRLAPGRPGRQAFFDSLGGAWMEPVRASTNWRILTALVRDLCGSSDTL